jgi:zinc transport system substrate-binding protein
MQHYNITFMLWRITLFFVISCFAASGHAKPDDKPLVVTSIKPLAIIASSALQDRARVEYVMPAGLSPHDVVLKLSDIRKLAKADLVFWIGPDFEISAAKQFEAIPEKKLFSAMKLIYPNYEGSISNNDSEQDDHEHGHDIDPHIWLSPRIANQLSEVLLNRLDFPASEVFTEQARLKTNALLAPVKDGNYMVHHQGIGYFVEEFQLKLGLSIRDMLGKQKGTKSQFNLRSEAKKLAVSCVFIEPQHGHKDAMAAAEDLSVPTTPIDILAVASGDQLPSYESYIHELATQFSACFK